MPSRELDITIAEKIMGWKRIDIETIGWIAPDGYYAKKLDEVPHYSTNIADAWEVVEKVPEIQSIMRHKGKWMVYFDPHHRDWLVTAPTAPEVICLAALRMYDSKYS